MIRRPPRSTQSRSSAASDVYKRQGIHGAVPYDEGHEGHEGHGRKPGQHAQRTSRRKEMIAERHDAPATKRCGGSVAAPLKSPCRLPQFTTWKTHGRAGRSAAKGVL